MYTYSGKTLNAIHIILRVVIVIRTYYIATWQSRDKVLLNIHTTDNNKL